MNKPKEINKRKINNHSEGQIWQVLCPIIEATL